jgi:hypothetical protein
MNEIPNIFKFLPKNLTQRLDYQEKNRTFAG